MRITHNTIVSQSIFDMQRSLKQIEETRAQLATGRRIQRPSDDPVDVFRVLGLHNKDAGIQQHIRNIDNALARMNQTETVLADMNDILIRLKERDLQLGTQPTVNDRDRENAVASIEQFKQEMIQLANTRTGNQYLFAGTNTGTRPYEANGEQVVYHGNLDEIFVEVEDNSTVPINLPGPRVFDASPEGIFQMLEDFKTALNTNDSKTLKEIIDRIDAYTETVLNARAVNAARIERMEISQERLSGDEIDTAQALSQTEDLDLARAITEFAERQNAYQVAIAAAAQAIQPSLLSMLV
jgi:flagellar hook-associated protein 3 FlgL